MSSHVMTMIAAFLLDLCFGDPYWMPHPVRAIGWLIGKTEKFLRARLPQNETGERIGGGMLVLFILSATGLWAFGILWMAEKIHPIFRWIVESFMCYQMLAARSLKTESMKVYDAFQNQDTEGARYAVSMIVGRDTKPLSETGIIKAAVETVAENTSDGVIAPLFYMALGKAPLVFLYKAVNTMDSMVGYKNDRYFYFGRCAARLDDLVNLIPSRLSALLMIAAAPLLKLDGAGALRIFLRDRYHHKSPNSAQTEAVCAGALDVQLAGDAYYFGELYHKPTIGDDIRPVEPEDIRRANGLMMAAAWLAVAVLTAVILAVSA